MIDTAVLLAAGKGTRLKPLTEKIPKSLLPVNGKPLIVHQIETLHKMGIKNIVINTHHLAEKIQKTLQDGSQFGVHLHYSYEPELLETGGGVLKALTLIETPDRPFLVLSSDIFTDFPFDKFLENTFLENF